MTESVITIETATRAITQMRDERDFAVKALRKMEAILKTPLDKGGDHHLQLRQERLLEICVGTCADLAGRQPL